MHLSVWRSRRANRPSPAPPISLTETAPDVDREGGTTTLHFRLGSSRRAELEAIRQARHAMIREEWARGLEGGEPSLTEAVFSARGVHWDVPIGEQVLCRKKLRTLVDRANRRLVS